MKLVRILEIVYELLIAQSLNLNIKNEQCYFIHTIYATCSYFLAFFSPSFFSFIYIEGSCFMYFTHTGIQA